MKKIWCVRDGKDFLKLVPSHLTNDEWFITMNPEACEVVLDARAIRKLRKQLKRALIEIENGSSGYSEKFGGHQISSSGASGPYIGNKFFLTELDDWPVSFADYRIEQARKNLSDEPA